MRQRFPAAEAGEPCGLLNQTGLNELIVNGPLTYDRQLESLAKCWASNVEPDVLIYDDVLRLAIAKFKDGEGSFLDTPGRMPAQIAALKKLTSTAVTSNVVGTQRCLRWKFPKLLFRNPWKYADRARSLQRHLPAKNDRHSSDGIH